MLHTLRSALAIALAITLATLWAVSATALTDKEALSRTIQKVDAPQGRLILTFEVGTTRELRAPPELLQGLQNDMT